MKKREWNFKKLQMKINKWTFKFGQWAMLQTWAYVTGSGPNCSPRAKPHRRTGAYWAFLKPKLGISGSWFANFAGWTHWPKVTTRLLALLMGHSFIAWAWLESTATVKKEMWDNFMVMVTNNDRVCGSIEEINNVTRQMVKRLKVLVQVV